MADETDAPVTNLHPAVEAAATGSAEPAVQMWAANAASMIQDHFQQRAILDQAAAQRDRFINDMAGARDQLVGMVKNDPTAATLAFQLGDSLHEAIGASHEGEDGPALAGQMNAHFRSEIAQAAVHGWADKDEGMARAALDRYGEHLSDDQKAGLDSYISGVQSLRMADAQAARITQAHQAVQASNRGTAGYIAALTHPQTGAVEFPPGWGQRMMQDPSLAPDAKAALFTGYSNLQRYGEPSASDPNLVTDLLARAALPYNHVDHPMTPEIAGHLGTNLTMADAQYLSGLLGPQSTATRAQTQAISDGLAEAEAQIGNRTAFARFVPAYLKAAQQGTLNLDPSDKGYSLAPERMQKWMPTGDDVIAPAIKASFMSRLGYFLNGEPSGPADELIKPGLDPNIDPGMEGKARDPAADTGDPVINQRQPGTTDEMRTHPGLLNTIDKYIEARRPSLGQIFAGNDWTGRNGPAQPEKQWPTGPQGREEDNPKVPPIKIPGGGSRPF